MSEETISELLRSAQKPLLSYEFFPPKDESGWQKLRNTAEALRATEPDFVTVTYGAGGSQAHRTMEACEMLRELNYAPVMPHLTCVGSSRSEIDRMADELYESGYRNIMTLRGDPPKGRTTFEQTPDGLMYAGDLVKQIKARQAGFCCGVAGYPETHPEAASSEADIAHLKEKLDAGASFITTQLFFENRNYFDYVTRVRNKGIDHPILAGLLPPVSIAQIRRITKLCGAKLPPALERGLLEAKDDPAAAAEVGIRWTAEQIEELVSHGVDGIHLYILNREQPGLSQSIIGPIRH